MSEDLPDFERLALLQSLVSSARRNVEPRYALLAAAAVVDPCSAPGAGMSPGRASRGRLVEAQRELAKLADPAAVAELAVTLARLAGGAFAPPIVGEAARLLGDPKQAAWLAEIGKLAALSCRA